MPECPEGSERPCSLTATHPTHMYWTGEVQHVCPGLPHDHETRCCVEHKHHVTPHRGCILR